MLKSASTTNVNICHLAAGDWFRRKGERAFVRVRAWNLQDAVAMAARIPYPQWKREEGWT